MQRDMRAVLDVLGEWTRARLSGGREFVAEDSRSLYGCDMRLGRLSWVWNGRRNQCDNPKIRTAGHQRVSEECTVWSRTHLRVAWRNGRVLS